jgi:acyl transferase domain-containing protein
MKTAVVIAPGRGTYNREQLGYLKSHHPDRVNMIAGFDAIRSSAGQSPVSTLDGEMEFNAKTHTTGDAASPLIYTSGLCDFQSITDYDILAVTGNSMGWYTALACAGAVTPENGFRISNTMGTLMQDHLIGAQIIMPFVDETWTDQMGRRNQIMELVANINGRKNAILGLSIDLGGMLVLAGDHAGIKAFEDEIDPVGNFPMRLPNHAAFHTQLQAPVAEMGRAQLGMDLFQQPKIPMIDGRGSIWEPFASDSYSLWDYTLGHQVIEPFDFTAAIRTAAREFMPDVFIVLGPGNTLGGASAQALIAANWRGWSDKATFQTSEAQTKRLISMGARL